MAKESVNAQGQNPDVLNFGLTLGDKVERKHGFKPRKELGDLCQGFLIGAVVEHHTAPEIVEKTGLASTWEYAGLDIPNLVVSFRQAPTKEDPTERVYDHRFQPFTLVKKDGTKADRKAIIDFYTEEYTKLRHIANAFKTNANFTEVAIPEFNPFLEDPIARLAQMTAWYTAWETMLKGKDGKGFPSQLNTIKMVASREGNYLAFPGFTAQGFIEKVVAGVKPSIELKPSETTVLVAKKSASKTTGAAGGGEDELSPELQAAMAAYQNKG